MRGLGLIVGFIMGNATARKWCIDNLKKASVIVDKELQKIPAYSAMIGKSNDISEKGTKDDSSRQSDDISIL